MSGNSEAEIGICGEASLPFGDAFVALSGTLKVNPCTTPGLETSPLREAF